MDLRIFMRKLRQKIEPEPNTPRILLTELGVGYRLAQEGDGGPWNGADSRVETASKAE